MPKRKDPPLTKKEQFKRFVETAKKLGIEECTKNAEREFKRLAKRSSSREPD